MAPVRYRLAMPEPHTHLFDVEVLVPARGAELALVMPSWTPGSYLLREFPRNVQSFQATTPAGKPLAVEKRDKNTWVVSVAAGAEAVVRYRVYANETSVRTSHLDASHAYVNGASVFMAVEGAEEEALELEIAAPSGWHVTTPLPAAPGRDGTWTAESFHHLVDSPLEIGTHSVLEFEVEGIPHRYAIWGRGAYDAERLVRDTTTVIRTARHFWGSLPYPHYTFFLHLLPGSRGGLEHRESCSLHADRWSFHGTDYEQFLALVTHEFFHTWNGTRLRPAPLARPDYTRENYTRNLWVVEGLTTYYTDLLLCRSGLISADRYLERLTESIGRYLALPGRGVQTLAEASFDTWIKFYRPDEHTPNAQVSYYHKGALVGLLLDMRIRRATGNRRSLDDVMRLLWERFGASEAGYPEKMDDGIRVVAEEVCGESLAAFFADHIFGLVELDFAEAFDVVGLELTTVQAPETPHPPAGPDSEGVPPPAPAAAASAATHRLGIRVEAKQELAVVAYVRAGSPAHRGGVNARDVLLGVDGLRVTAGDLSRILDARAVSGATDPLRLSALRRGELVTLEVSGASELAAPHRVTRLASPTAAQSAAFDSWVGAARANG